MASPFALLLRTALSAAKGRRINSASRVRGLSRPKFSEQALKAGAALSRPNKAVAAALQNVGFPQASMAFIVPHLNETEETRETGETVFLRPRRA